MYSQGNPIKIEPMARVLVKTVENRKKASAPYVPQSAVTLKKRAGQMHGIDSILAHRPSGNLLVWCQHVHRPVSTRIQIAWKRHMTSGIRGVFEEE
jgi:hypothetical protein